MLFFQNSILACFAQMSDRGNFFCICFNPSYNGAKGGSREGNKFLKIPKGLSCSKGGQNYFQACSSYLRFQAIISYSEKLSNNYILNTGAEMKPMTNFKFLWRPINSDFYGFTKP